MSGIYIHIPVCAQKCSYCDFYSVAAPGLLEGLLPCFHQEILWNKAFFSSRHLPLRTLYFGGGTPSLCSAQSLGDLIRRCESTFSVRWEEITVEANPDDLQPRYLEELLAAGVTRLSVGIQSFDDARLQQLNRRHTSLQARRGILEAQKAGFRNISVDWIYGLPEYTQAQWDTDLNHFIDLEVQHISAYHLSVEANTPLAQWVKNGIFTEIDDLESENQYLRLIRALAAAGYEHYEISNFCKPGFASKHNGSYWEFEPYLGIGPGAHGFDGVRRYANEHNVHSYLRTVSSEQWSQLLTVEEPTVQESLNDYLMTAFRTKKGLDSTFLRQRFGEEALRRFSARASVAVEKGTLQVQGPIYRIPEEKWLISDAIIEFFIQ